MTTETTDTTIVEIEGTDLDLTRIVDHFPEESTFGVVLPGTSALPVPITADVLAALRPEYPARLVNAVADALAAGWVVTVREIHENRRVTEYFDGEPVYVQRLDVRKVVIRLSANEAGLGAALSLFATDAAARRSQPRHYGGLTTDDVVGFTFVYGRPNKGRGWRSSVDWSAEITYLRKETRQHRLTTYRLHEDEAPLVGLDECEVGLDNGLAIKDLRVRFTTSTPSTIVEAWEESVHEQHVRDQNVAAYDRDARTPLRDALTAFLSTCDGQAERQQAEAVDLFVRDYVERAEEYRLKADATRWAKSTVESVLRVEGQVDGTEVLTLEQALANVLDVERRYGRGSDRQQRLAVAGATLIEVAVRGQVRVARTVTVSLVD